MDFTEWRYKSLNLYSRFYEKVRHSTTTMAPNEVASYGQKSVSILRNVFTIIDKIFIFGGRLYTRV